MKKIFNAPSIEIVLIDADIITTSGTPTVTEFDPGGTENRDGHNETPDW